MKTASTGSLCNPWVSGCGTLEGSPQLAQLKDTAGARVQTAGDRCRLIRRSERVDAVDQDGRRTDEAAAFGGRLGVDHRGGEFDEAETDLIKRLAEQRRHGSLVKAVRHDQQLDMHDRK
jgi:hypothetical protein